jgi:hypothetical protein
MLECWENERLAAALWRCGTRVSEIQNTRTQYVQSFEGGAYLRLYEGIFNKLLGHVRQGQMFPGSTPTFKGSGMPVAISSAVISSTT